MNGDAHNFWNHRCVHASAGAAGSRGQPVEPVPACLRSCDPNVWISSDDSIVARRDIRAGEEMCFDYSTTDCRCVLRW